MTRTVSMPRCANRPVVDVRVLRDAWTPLGPLVRGHLVLRRCLL
ncbi:hypothetical protein [Streptomyces tubbatahanensis]|nr:hypothetical protein [Streptomyces tubbatahanensis]